jgi:hypothetical protein
MPQDLFVGSDAPLSLVSLFINLLIGIVLSIVLSFHFRTFGSTLSNREGFSSVFPLILLTTVLVISIVKSSLALSLGLVGALSIVRFRTPIKEPEELAYLFLAIAMGLGLGAAQTVPTVLASAVILIAMAMRKVIRKTDTIRNLYMSVDLDAQDNDAGDLKGRLEELNVLISQYVAGCDLRRFDLRGNLIDATYFPNVESTTDLSQLSDQLRLKYPEIGITFIDQNNMPSV